ncbi:hypothetical protein JQ582_33060 [Bradyrhizobium japonicum]|uniref:hypothetical protein n=1 Tax=Bradyrhizobium japonicum TaxID=375 RepID=UPI001BAD9CB8|nr:hypothetical protein [Bradyrhizobium japonicum]MBR0748772.1 hypothetical protein [Bradyrhizobium japonicum]
MAQDALIRGLLANAVRALGSSLLRIADRLGGDAGTSAIPADPLAALRLKFPSAPDHWLRLIAERTPHFEAGSHEFVASFRQGLPSSEDGAARVQNAIARRPRHHSESLSAAETRPQKMSLFGRRLFGQASDGAASAMHPAAPFQGSVAAPTQQLMIVADIDAAEIRPQKMSLFRRRLFGQTPDGAASAIRPAAPFQGSVATQSMIAADTVAADGTDSRMDAKRRLRLFQPQPTKRNRLPMFVSPALPSTKPAVATGSSQPKHRKKTGIVFNGALGKPNVSIQWAGVSGPAVTVPKLARNATSKPRNLSLDMGQVLSAAQNDIPTSRDQIGAPRSDPRQAEKETSRSDRRTAAAVAWEAVSTGRIVFAQDDNSHARRREQLGLFVNGHELRELWADLPPPSAESELTYCATRLLDERRRIERLKRDQIERIWNG